jgi:hypothetical protein
MALSLLGVQHRIRRVRADSGFYANHFPSFLEERALPSNHGGTLWAGSERVLQSLKFGI